MGIAKVIMAVTVTGLLFARPVQAKEERFWTAVNEVLKAHRVYNESNFQIEFYTLTALARIRRFEQDYPTWATVHAGILRKGRPQGKTVRQLYLMFPPEEGRRVLEAAQWDRRREFGLAPDAPLTGDLFKFIEREELAGNLPFQPRRKLFEGYGSWKISAAAAQKLLCWNSPPTDSLLNFAIERVLNWIEQLEFVSDESKSEISTTLQSWKYVKGSRSSRVPLNIIEQIVSELTEHVQDPSFDPQQISITPFQHKLLVALERVPLTGPEIRRRIGGNGDTPIDKGQFSRTIRALVAKRLVIEVEGPNGTSGNNWVKMYALTPEGWDLIEYLETRGLDCAVILSPIRSTLRDEV